MKTFYQIDLLRIPDSFDIAHVGLLVMVLILLLILFVFASLLLPKLIRKRKSGVSAVAAKTTIKVKNPVPVMTSQPVTIKEMTTDAASQLLSLLQKEARFIDFITEDISRHNDQDIGVVARVVHDGCAKVIKETFNLTPIREEAENSQVTIEKNFNANNITLTGNMIGEPPFTGTLIHKGWKVSKIQLPRITEGHNINIIAPAEVEL